VPAQLLALGFPEWKCVIALQLTQGNAETAAGILVEYSGEPDEWWRKEQVRTPARTLGIAESLTEGHGT
jgi:hypothetical protein